ncbi:MAG TPA: NF038122 family metalloprotease [Chthoniobacter sp.]|jgi:autotransporter-associated beta strand protein
MSPAILKKLPGFQKTRTSLSLAAAVAMVLAGNRQAQALSITPIFDSSITNDPNAATIEASIETVVTTYETLFLDPINLSVTFSEMSGGLGESDKFLTTDTYTDFLSKLTASQTSASDTTALAHLPTQSTNPVNGSASMQMSTANAEALGIFTGSNTTSATIQLNTSIMNLSRSGTQNPNNYDLVSTVEHELDEVLGLGSALVNGSNGLAAPTGAVMPEDLFRYDQNGNRSFTTSATAQAYFSIDGTTHIAQFNQQSGSDPASQGDFGDWYSYQVAHTPQVQDAFGTPGIDLNIGTSEKTALDVIGYTLLTSLTWNPTSSASGTPPDGAGIWTTASGSTWWNGTANSVWSNTNVQNAQFGTAGTASSTAYIVTLGSAITVGEMVFGNANYTINGGGNSLTINGGIVAAVNATVDAPVILGGNNTWETAGPITLAVGGNVSGGFMLTKQGTGTLILSGTNSYAGGTTISDGTLQTASAGALPTGHDVTMNGGTLDINGQTPSIGNLTFGDGVTAVIGSVIDSAATKGSLTLGGNITYTGTLDGGSYFFDVGTLAANVTLASGTHHITTADTGIAANYDLVISGNMSGTGGISKDGVNYIALTGANTYSGATAITNGWLFTAATNTLSANSDVTVSGGILSLNPQFAQTGVVPGSYNQTIGSLAGTGQVHLGTATLTVGADNASTTFSGAISDAGGGTSGSGSLTKTGTGTFIINSSQGYFGATTINNGTLQLGDGTNTGFIANSSGVTGLSTGTLAFDFSGNFSFPLSIGGAVNVTQAGPNGNFVFLTGNNTYTGMTTVNSGTGIVVGNGGTTGSLGTGNTTNNGAVDFERTDMLVVSSAISGPGSVTIFSGGTIVFTGTDSYSGTTTISSGTLQLGNAGTSGSLSALTSVSGNAGNTLAFNRTDSFTVGSRISGGLTVAQNGTGITTLSATNSTFTGPTNINAGTLLVSGSISGSTVTVNNSGTLAGNGSVGAVNVASGGTVLPGSSTGSGLLDSGSEIFASGSHLMLELGGTTGTNTAGVTYSELSVTGTVSLAGNVQVSLFGGYTPRVNDIFYIILNDGSDGISGTFSNAPGGIFTSDGIQFQVNYAANGDSGSTANDVSIQVLSVVPEPGSWLLLLGGWAIAAGLPRRRRA